MPMYCGAVNCSSKSDSTISSFFSIPEGHIPVSGTYKISLSDALLVSGVQPRLLPVRGLCHLPVCVLRIQCPFHFPPLLSSPHWVGTKCGAGRDCGAGPNTCTKRGCAGPISRTFCTIPKIHGTGSSPAGLHGIRGARDDATSGKPQCS